MTTETSVAEAVVAAVAARDGAALGDLLADDVELEALLPARVLLAHGPEEVAAAFEGWFGDLPVFELVAATAGEIGPRLHLRWRFRAVRDGVPSLVEQHVYADPGGDGRLQRLRLLCSGFCPA